MLLRLWPFHGSAPKIAEVAHKGRAAFLVRSSSSSSSSSHNDALDDAARSKQVRIKRSDSSASSSSSSSSSSQSTVERGTIFENHTLAYLEHTFPRMALMRSGGANDRGVDLTGWWWHPLRGEADAVPDSDDGELQRIRVTVQCKAEATKLGPRHIRELHGTMSGRFKADDALDQTGISSGGDDDSASTTAQTPMPVAVPSMAILASSAGFSKQCVLQAMSAPFPLLLLHLLHPQHDRNAPSAPPPYPFVCPTISVNEALRTNLLRGHLDVRWLATLVQSPRSTPRGRAPAPVRMDRPFIFLGGKKR